MAEYPSYLIHYGTPGQKWGVRKYQNEDGTWTEEGLRRRRKEQKDLYKSVKNDVKKGTFNPDDYKYNNLIRKEIDKKDLYNLTKDRNNFNKKYNKALENQKKRDSVYNEYYDRVDKEATEAIEGKKFKTESEKYDALEAARFEAENRNRDKLFKELDKKGLNFDTKYPEDIGGYKEYSKKNFEVASAIDDAADSIIGKYSNKNIGTIKMNEPYRAYVNDIIKNIVDKELERQEEAEKFRKEYEKKLPKMLKDLEDADMITENRYWDVHLKNRQLSDDEIFKKDKRLNDAAITGLKALDGPEVDLSTSNKWWFICEDQTIGYATIADLANRGYSEKQIKDLVKTANNYYYNPIHEETAADLGMKVPKGTWHLTELYDGDKFIEDCVKVAKENTLSDAKQSRIKSLIASGKSQEEVAKMLGVSTSTVNKYK